jgi:hypothetical protein
MTQTSEGPPRWGSAGGPEVVCFDGEQLPNNAPAQKYQARISRSILPRENACHGSNHDRQSHGRFWPRKVYTNETTCTANRVCRQDVLDCPRHGSLSLVVLLRAAPGRDRARSCAAEKNRLEGAAPHGAGEAKGCSRGMKSRRGPSSQRSRQCRARWQP